MTYRWPMLAVLITIYFIDVTVGQNDGKHLLISADFTRNQDFLLSGTHDYIKVSVVRNVAVGRQKFPTCLAVGCTKTGIICDKKGGQMMTTFRSVNDTRQAFFRSTLASETLVLSVNCREFHIACCFQDKKGLSRVAAPVVRVQVNASQVVAKQPQVLWVERPAAPPPPTTILTLPAPPPATVLRLPAPAVPPPAILRLPAPAVPLPAPAIITPTLPSIIMPLQVNVMNQNTPTPPPINPLKMALLQKIINKTNPTTTPAPAPAPSGSTNSSAPASQAGPPSRPPIKLYLFSNVCLGFLGGAGFVHCNRH